MQPYTIYWTSVQLENKEYESHREKTKNYDAMTNSLFPGYSFQWDSCPLSRIAVHIL